MRAATVCDDSHGFIGTTNSAGTASGHERAAVGVEEIQWKG
jgi:hypothetical protein